MGCSPERVKDSQWAPNSVPPPEGISEAAKKVWPSLPQIPLQAYDLKQCCSLEATL